MRSLTRSVLACSCLAAALAISACAADDAESTGDAAAGQESAPPDPTREEVTEPHPRLVVAFDDNTAVLDTGSGEVLASFPADGPKRLTAIGDGRHVALVDADAGTTQFLDAGAWSSAHGDHFHHYVAEPTLRTPAVEGDRPVHVVSNAGRTAVFHDDSGTAEVFDDDGLLIDSVATTTIDSGAPHHGVVVPLADGALVTIPGTDALPVGVARVDDDGTRTAQFDDCPGLHGEIVVADTAVFGCETGIMLVSGDSASSLPNPDESGERVGGFVAGADSTVVGDYAADSLAVVDVAARTFDVVDAAADVAAYTTGPHGDILALGTDGALRRIDPTTGGVDATVKVLEPFELPEGHGGVKPSLAVAGHRAFVADPETSTLTPVDLETFTSGEPIALQGAPSDLVATGTAP